MEGGFLEKNGSLSMRGRMFNGVMHQCRREILWASQGKLRAQKSPQGLRRAGFQDVHQSTLVIADGEFWWAGVPVISHSFH